MAATIQQLKDFPNLCTTSGDLKYEIERLLTFHEITHPKLTSVQLSGNGFYYDMVLKKILCHFCKTVLKTSESILKHESSCKYKNDNIPVHEYDEVNNIANQISNQHIDLEPDDIALSNSEENKTGVLDYQKRFDTYKTWKPNSPVKPEDLAQSGFYFLGYSDVVKCAFCSVELRNWTEGDIVHDVHSRHNPNCSNVQNSVLSKMDLKSELNRIKSFDRWSSFHPLRPNDLAKNGFYHKGPADNVSCVFCKCELRNWKVNDNIEEKHRTISPNCPFLCDKNIDNEPKAARCETLLNHPKHPNFALLSERLKTFANWPKHSKQKPKDLAEAGFFYNGKSDTVICFCCDGGLCKWDEEDIPWQEHARSFPQCTFIQQMKVPDSIASESMEFEVSSYSEDSYKQDDAEIPEDFTTFPNTPELDPALVKENRMLKEFKLCKMCLDKELSVAFLPCGHLVTCESCGPSLNTCPFCQKHVHGMVKTYF